jgi:hypothetical protein
MNDLRSVVIERFAEAARRGRSCRKNKNERRLRLKLMEGAKVGLCSSSFWRGEPICESGVQLGLDLRAKAFRPYNTAHRRVQNSLLFD